VRALSAERSVGYFFCYFAGADALFFENIIPRFRADHSAEPWIQVLCPMNRGGVEKVLRASTGISIRDIKRRSNMPCAPAPAKTDGDAL
jgi:hypothetical protein